MVRHKWIALILSAVTFCVVLLFCPETRYARPHSIEQEGTASSSSQSASQSPPDEEVIPDAPVDKSLSSRSKEVSTGHLAFEEEPVPKKTFSQELSLWSGVPKDTSLLELFIRPFPLIAYPAVIYSFLGYAVSLGWVLAINVLSPFVLQAPPYGWAASVQGLINVPGIIGNLLGAWLGGWLVDRYSDWRSKKNAGVFQPEMRLHLLVIPALIVPAGCLAFGYGVAEQLHWTSLFFGE